MIFSRYMEILNMYVDVWLRERRKEEIVAVTVANCTAKSGKRSILQDEEVGDSYAALDVFVSGK